MKQGFVRATQTHERRKRLRAFGGRSARAVDGGCKTPLRQKRGVPRALHGWVVSLSRCPRSGLIQRVFECANSAYAVIGRRFGRRSKVEALSDDLRRARHDERHRDHCDEDHAVSSTCLLVLRRVRHRVAVNSAGRQRGRGCERLSSETLDLPNAVFAHQLQYARSVWHRRAFASLFDRRSRRGLLEGGKHLFGLALLFAFP